MAQKLTRTSLCSRVSAPPRCKHFASIRRHQQIEFKLRVQLSNVRAASHRANIMPGDQQGEVYGGIKEEEKETLMEMDQHHGHGLARHHEVSKGGYAFFMPPMSLLGDGALAETGGLLKSNPHLTKALVVTDEVLNRLGAIEPVLTMLKDAGKDYIVYDQVKPNPTVQQVSEGVAEFKKGADFIVSFGGGSPHDCAKGIGIVASNGGSIKDYEGVDQMKTDMPYLIAINTTAGTASELTRFTIITDTERHTKMAIVDRRCTPTLAVNDPQLMINMPKGLTAATGMDALTHAIEAYVSNASFPITDASALAAIRIIPKFLPTAVKEPTNIEARDMMAYAEYLAGMAFNSAGLGYVHAMSHQLGGFYDLPHGVCNAVLLPAVQEFNAKHVPELFIDIHAAMSGGGSSLGAKDAVDAVLKNIRSLSKEVGIPANLKELKVDPKDFDVLATNAMKDACAASNPVPLSHKDVVGLFQQAYDQK